MKTVFPTLIFLSLFPNAATALFRCLFQPTRRCGFLNLGVTLRVGEPGESCVEQCSFMVSSPYKCGTCGDNVADNYDITLGFDAVPMEDTILFTQAAARWEAIVTKGLPPVFTYGRSDASCEVPFVIDDVFFCVRYVNIDGVNGSIGSSRILNSQISSGVSRVPVVADFTVDVADVGNLKERVFYSSYVLRAVGRALGKIFQLVC
jgi:hypothetical protein